MATTLVSTRLLTVLAILPLVSSCYVFEFFTKKSRSGGGGGDVFTGVVIGQTLGEKAGGADSAALASIYAISAAQPPAALRPDPDVFIRRLLLQYRSEGATVAQQIGAIEPFRLLLGGASEDFATAPQEEYDATSLLAVFKVAEEACYGLVAPTAAKHPGWVTILPFGADQEQANIEWLAQRFIGLPKERIDAKIYTDLHAIMIAEEPALAADSRARDNPYAKYVPVCATLALDAEALYL